MTPSDDTPPPPLPPLYGGELGLEQVEALFHDYGCAELCEVSIKTEHAGFSRGEGLSLASARQGLLYGGALAVQVRYRYCDEEWWDTLLSQPSGGYRLVRVRAPRPS
jgi:hypothetical protein